MQEGSKLLLSLIDSGKIGFTTFIDLQLDANMFRGSEEDLYKFIRGHVSGYGKLPERKTVKTWADEHKTTIPPKKSLVEPSDYYYDEMKRRNLRLNLKSVLQSAAEQVNEDTPFEALQDLTSSVVEMANQTRKNQLLNFAQHGQELMKTEMAKVGSQLKPALQFGWPTFDNMAGGLSGGDVVSFVGRPAMGKTYMLLYGAIAAWRQGKVPLFVSMEMKTTLIAQRITALHTKTSITEIMKAKVGKWKYKKMLGELGVMKKKQDFWIADGALSATVEDIIMLCHQLKPDVVYIDGAYLLQNTNHRLQRWERVSTNAEAIKCQLAEALDIPVVVSYQLNRETEKKKIKEVGVENIAYSDAIGQLSSVVLGLFQEESVETMLQRDIRILKGRHGESGEFTINWRFGGMGQYFPTKDKEKQDTDTHNVMNFSEILDEYSNKSMHYIE